MTKKHIENKIENIDDREHILLRPSMYIGSMSHIEHETIFLENGKFGYKTYESVDGLLKIINEIIDNSTDEAVRTHFDLANIISVDISKDTVTVKDNGRGLPTSIEENTGLCQAVVAFTRANTGSNFRNDAERVTAGVNGVGSLATNVFSTSFVVDTCNGDKQVNLVCSNNAENINHTIKNAGKKRRGTTVTFKPDLKLFGMTQIDKLHTELIRQRLIHLAFTYPKIQFRFNKQPIKISTDTYVKAFGENVKHITTDNWLIAVMPNEFDDFRQVSFVNGLDLKNGGNHVDYISKCVISRLRDKFVKKHKLIKIGDIKNKLKFVVIFRGFPDFKCDSQTKDMMSNSLSDIRSYLGQIDWDKFVKSVLKVPDIVDPILEMFKLKEELKARRELATVSKIPKKLKIKKYLAPIKRKKYLSLCEGASAVSGLSASLGRDEIGYYELKGVPLNTYEAPVSKITKNNEIVDIVNILGLRLDKPVRTMKFDKILMSTDMDLDGFHIRGLLIAFFMKFAPDIVIAGKLCSLRTPVVAVKKGTLIKQVFFTIPEFNAYQAKHNVHASNIKYYKGLGSWGPGELQQLIRKNGLDKYVETITYDPDAVEVIDNWLSSKKVDVRKEYLRNNSFSIYNM